MISFRDGPDSYLSKDTCITTGNPHLLNSYLAKNYSKLQQCWKKETYDQSLKLWPLQHPHCRMSVIQVFGNQHTFTIITASCDHLITIFSLLSWFPITQQEVARCGSWNWHCKLVRSCDILLNDSATYQYSCWSQLQSVTEDYLYMY